MSHHELEDVDADSPIRSITSFNPLHGSPSDDTSAISKAMRDARCGALLIDDGEGGLGIVTERDVVRALADGRTDAAAIDLMTRDLIIVLGDTPIGDAALIMQQAGVRHLAVDRGDGVIGIMSIRDLLEPLLDTIGD